MDRFYDIVGYFGNFQTFIYPELQDYIIGLFEVNLFSGYIFTPHFGLPENVLNSIR